MKIVGLVRKKVNESSSSSSSDSSSSYDDSSSDSSDDSSDDDDNSSSSDDDSSSSSSDDEEQENRPSKQMPKAQRTKRTFRAMLPFARRRKKEQVVLKEKVENAKELELLPAPTEQDLLVDKYGDLEISMSQMTNTPDKLLLAARRSSNLPTRDKNNNTMQTSESRIGEAPIAEASVTLPDQPSSTKQQQKNMEVSVEPKSRRLPLPTTRSRLNEEMVPLASTPQSDEKWIARNRSIPRLIHVNASFENSLAPLRKLSREHKTRRGKPLQSNRNGRLRVMDMDSIEAASQQKTRPPKRTLALPTPCEARSFDGGQISPVGGFGFEEMNRVVKKKELTIVQDEPVQNDDEQENDEPAVEMRPMVIGSNGQTFDKILTSSNTAQVKPRRPWMRSLGKKNRDKQLVKHAVVDEKTSTATVKKMPEPIQTTFSSPKRKASTSLDTTMVGNKSPRPDNNFTSLADLKTDGLCGNVIGFDNGLKRNETVPEKNVSTENAPCSVAGMRNYDSLLSADDDDGASAQASTSAKTHTSTKTTTTKKSQKTHIDQIEVEMKGKKFAMLQRLFGRGVQPVKVSVATVPKPKESSDDKWSDEVINPKSPVGKEPVHQQQGANVHDSDDHEQTSTRAVPLSVQVDLSNVDVQCTEEAGQVIENTPHAIDELALNDLGTTVEKSFTIDSMGPNFVDDRGVAHEKALENISRIKQAEKQQNRSIAEKSHRRGDSQSSLKHIEKQVVLKQNRETALASSFGDLFNMMFQTKKETSTAASNHQAKKVDKYRFDMCGAVYIDAIEEQGIEVDDNNTITASFPTAKHHSTRASSRPELNGGLDDISLASDSVKVTLIKPLAPKQPSKKNSGKAHAKKKSTSNTVKNQIDLAQVDLTPETEEIDQIPAKEEAVAARMKEELSPMPVKKSNAPAVQISNFFNPFASTKKTNDEEKNMQDKGPGSLRSPAREGQYLQGDSSKHSSYKLNDRLESFFENDSMANTWAEIADASLVVERAMDRINTLGSDVTDTSRKVHDLLSLESLDTVGDDVEQALNVLRKHANRLGVRESELLLAVKSNDYESKDDESSVRTLTFGEELMEAFNLYMKKPKKGQAKK